MNKTYERYLTAIEDCLAATFPGDDRLSGAMRYSLLAGGKRVRPVLCLEFCRVCGGDWKKALPAACGIEMLHGYSLIHDDLPCMDDDDMRRGKPACHIAFGETTAVLAGDCLQAEAFASVCRAEIAAADRACCAALLAKAAGLGGICGGQMDDLLKPGDKQSLLDMERRKTAVLIACACAMGAACAGAEPERVTAAENFGLAMGMAFQLRDDVLDGDGYCAMAGQDECSALADEYTRKALAELDGFDDTDFLRELTIQLAGRKA